MLEQSWIHLLFSQCLLLCRCCLRSWLRDFGTGTSENSSGYLYCHSGQEGKIPLMFTQQYCLDLLPTSVVLKLISGSAPTQPWIWTPGSFHAVTLPLPQSRALLRVSDILVSTEIRKKKKRKSSIPLLPMPFFYVFLFLLFDASSGLTRLAADIKMQREGEQLACVRVESNFKGMERKQCREDLTAVWGNSAN